MPASLPGSSAAENVSNPTAGTFVTFDPLSGPKGSPNDAKVINYATGTPPGWNATTRIPILIAATGPSSLSTGQLSTGIGFSSQPIIGLTAPASIKAASYSDDYAPGATLPGGTLATDSRLMYIGGGRMIANAGVTVADYARPFIVSPYTAGTVILGAGQGGSRDGGAGPAFTGFPLKLVTAAGAVANGAVVETGFVNRSGGSLITGQSVFGSGSTASAAPV